MHGKVELERLIVEVVRALRDANMHDTLRAFDERVLSRRPEIVFDTSADGSEPCFKPMVELLLRELAALGANTSASTQAREALAAEAMHLAGF